MAKDHGPQIKDDEAYEALRREGASKEKAARIANAQAKGTIDHSRSGEKYEERTKADLMDEARRIGIEGRSKMNKDELIEALRNH